MPCYKPLQGFKRMDNGGLTFVKAESSGVKMEVACGQCLGCRLDRSREWASRMIHEAAMHKDNCFLTLTYDDEHVPQLYTGGPGTLIPKHFTDFMKRLRWHCKNDRIRYYMCGEYGDETRRPHYHACLFGIDFADKIMIGANNDGEPWYSSPSIERIWDKGFNTLGALTWESAAYVSRYIMKKRTGKQAEDHYLRCDDYGVAYWLEPEYNSMSRGYRCKEHRDLERRPDDCDKCTGGIGADWYAKYKNDVFPSDEMPLPNGVRRGGVPRFYEEILQAEDPDTYEAVKESRKKYYFTHREAFSPERLETKYKCAQARTKRLKREGI